MSDEFEEILATNAPWSKWLASSVDATSTPLTREMLERNLHSVSAGGRRPQPLIVSGRTYHVIDLRHREQDEARKMRRGWRPIELWPRLARAERRYHALRWRLRNLWADIARDWKEHA